MYLVTSGATGLNSDSTGRLGGARAAGRCIFFSTMCIYYRHQVAKNNTHSQMWFTRSEMQKTALWLCPGSICCSRNGGASADRFSSVSPFSRAPSSRSWSTTVIESPSLCSTSPWYRKKNLKRQNKPAFSLITWLPCSSSTRWNWQSDLDEGNTNWQSLITGTFYTFT